MVSPRLVLAAFAVALLVPSAAAEDARPLYFGTERGDVNGLTGVLLLTNTTGDGATTALSALIPALGPPSIAWYTPEPFGVDMEIHSPVPVALTFSVGVEALAAVRVDLLDVGPDGTVTTIGTQPEEVLLSVLPRTTTITVLPFENVVLQGHALGIQVTVEGTTIIAQLQYGSAGALSGVAAFPIQVLDSDGDGVGDSAERATGTDPFSADSPGGRPEVAIASGLLILALAVAGVALLGRYS